MPNRKSIRTKPPFFHIFGFIIVVVGALRGTTSNRCSNNFECTTITLIMELEDMETRIGKIMIQQQ